MIFNRLTPWENNRQRDLLRACFHTDPATARATAMQWQESYELDDVTYPEHRVLVRLFNRFPDVFSDETSIRVSGLKRQLWVRGNLNLKITAPILTLLSEFDIPWVFSGEAQWFAKPDFPHRESADIIEISVPTKAFSATTQILKHNGWHPGWASLDAAEGMVFSLFTKESATLRLVKADALLAYNPNQVPDMWQNIESISSPLGMFFTPSPSGSIALAIGKARVRNKFDNGWIFDLFNTHADPVNLLQKSTAPKNVVRLVSKLLSSQFTN